MVASPISKTIVAEIIKYFYDRIDKYLYYSPENQLAKGALRHETIKASFRAFSFWAVLEDPDNIATACLQALSIATDLRKHTILAHVNKGIKPRPGTMKTYADTFSEKLGRQISVFDPEK